MMRALAVVAAAIALVVACDDESQPPLLGDCTGQNCNPVLSSGAGPTDGGCGITTGIAACDQCLALSCCSVDTACAGSADCIALLECIDGCASNDTICVEDCLGANEGGVTPYNSFVTCVSNACNIACAPETD
jgi:hypothetical protein